MGIPNIPDAGAGVHFSEIRWTLGEPWPPLEDADLRLLDDDEVRTYAAHLQEETTWLRRLLHEALRQLHTLTGRLAAATRTIRELRRQLRERRA